MATERFCVIVTIDIEIEDSLAMQASLLALVQDADTGQVSPMIQDEVSLMTAIGGTGLRAAYQHMSTIDGLKVRGGSARTWPARPDGSYENFTLPGSTPES